MADSKEPPKDAPPPPRFWLYADKRIQGPYGLRLLRRLKGFTPEILAAPVGSKSDEDWKPAKDYPELQALLASRSEAKPKAPASPPERRKPSRPAPQPFPEEPNYLLWFLGLLLAGGALAAGVNAWKSRPASAPASSSAEQEEKAPDPAQMWPEPGAPADRVEAEGLLLELYFPLLLSRQGVKPDQIPAACSAAKEFIAEYESFKSRFGKEPLESFSQRVAVTMRAEKRTAPLLKRLDKAGSRGVDLSTLKHAKNLRQNMSADEFGMDRALDNARFLLGSVCAAS